MDKTMGDAEESKWKTDSAASASKFLGPLFQITSIAMDINSGATEDNKSPVHEHFTIRGYVAGMRRKDWNACLPFANSYISDNVGDLQPPLSVPTFRWWRCSNCIRDDDHFPPPKRNKELAMVCIKSDDTDPPPGKKGKATDMPCKAPSGSDDRAAELLRKRKRKLRSLADIMVEENKSNSDNRSASSSGVRVTSFETEPLTSQLELNVPSDVVESSRSRQRKSKPVLEEEEEDAELLIGTVNPTKGRAALDADDVRGLEISEHESADGLKESQFTKLRKSQAADLDHAGKKLITDDDGGVRTRNCSENLDDDDYSQSKMGHHHVLANEEDARDYLVRPCERESEVGSKNAKGKVGCDKDDEIADFNSHEASRRYIPDLNQDAPQFLDQICSVNEAAACDDLRLSKPQNDENGKRICDAASDDFHLVKNQHERAPGRFVPLDMIDSPHPSKNGGTLGMPEKEEIQFVFSSSSEQRKMQFSSLTIPGGTQLMSWPTRRENFDPDLNQKNHSLQQNSSVVYLSDQYEGRGKTKQKKPLRNGTAKKEGGIKRRSLDPYSNNTIPLKTSLTNNASFELGLKNHFLDKHLNGHPPLLDRKENSNLLAISQSKEMITFPGHVRVVCTLNKNPAEFSVPDARNKYTISARSLKPIKKQRLHR